MKDLAKEIGFIFGICYVVGLVSSIYHLNNLGLPLFPTNIFLSINELFYGAIMVCLSFITLFTMASIINSECIKDANKWLEWSSYNKSKPFTRKMVWWIRFISTLQIYVFPFILLLIIIVEIITNLAFNYDIICFYLTYILTVSLGAYQIYRSVKGRIPKDDKPMIGKYVSPIFGVEKIDLVNLLIGITIIAIVYSFTLFNIVSPTFGGGMPVPVIPYIDESCKNKLFFNDNSKLDRQEVYLIGQSLEYLAFSKYKNKDKNDVIFLKRDKLIALKNANLFINKLSINNYACCFCSVQYAIIN